MHSLILGMSESGKSSCAKRLIAQYRESGIATLVCDPLGNTKETWGCDYIAKDHGEFLRTYWDSKSCAAFFDEAAIYCGQHDKDFVQTATQGRHFGHSNHYISQRGTLLSRTIRDQCGRIFLFNSSLSDCKTHADEWNCPEFLKVPELPAGTCYTKTRFTQAKLIKLF